ncbi:AfsR/SARP family transcriptional regulator [Nocardioides sp. NPDC101246]|uniref:AfsR/SARP family transcriptional regulator n=1 Tax=Nocardioides sp. NPDC101246 TaxID=3364336 RepID=UPI003822124C
MLPTPTSRDIRFGLLGAFEATVDGDAVKVPGSAEQALLAVLLLARGRIVPASALIDRLWADSSLPADPLNALQLRVSKLRRAFKAVGLDLVQRDGGGYRAAVDPGSIDAEAFERRIREVRASVAGSGSPTEEDLATYDAALGLWRGEALADFATEPWAVPESVRLEDLRRTAYAERAQIALSLGRHAEVVTDLEPLLRTDPTHEAMAGLLMVALYRAGRQADALEVFTRTRKTLDADLGLEPSASLRSLHERVLRQDPSLGSSGEVTLSTPATAPHRARSAAQLSNLPADLTPLVGRDELLAALSDRVGTSRLTTLVGPGGSGKTALGLRAAHELADRFPDGTFLVRLASIRSGEHIVPAVAAAVAMPQDGSAIELQTRLVDFLTDKHLLLVIDNCEHLIDPVATLVEQLLAHCPQLTVIATSREPLAVPSEVQTPVGPLPTPFEDDDAETIASTASVQLLVRRITTVVPGIETDPEAYVALGRIARALDGMPLALELAAARASSLSPSDLADRLDQRFTLLTSGPRTAEERQRTLRATVDWSYDLLDDLEKRVFEGLAVFHGGWTLTAAEQVLADDETDPSQVIHAVGRLVEQSLIVAERGPVTRYRMLETLREYAADRLARSGRSDALATRHARYFAQVAERSAQAMRGQGDARARHLLVDEQANVRSAIAWLEGPAGDIDAALRLAGHLGLFWHQGRHLEGRRILRRLLEQGRGSAAARAAALQAVALVERPRACVVHPHPRCAEAARESLAIFLADGDADGAAVSRVLLAVEGVNGADPEAAALLDDAETWFRERGDRWGLAVAGFVRLETALKARDESAAIRLGRATAAEFGHLDDPWGQSAVLYHLGYGLRHFGRLRESARTLEQAIDVAASAGIHNTVQWALADLGITHLDLGDEDSARDAFRRAELASRHVGDRAGSVLAAYGRGRLAERRQDWASAISLLMTAIQGFETLETPAMTAKATLALARCHEQMSETEAAAERYEEARTLGLATGEVALADQADVALARLGDARTDGGRTDQGQ